MLGVHREGLRGVGGLDCTLPASPRKVKGFMLLPPLPVTKVIWRRAAVGEVESWACGRRARWPGRRRVMRSIVSVELVRRLSVMYCCCFIGLARVNEMNVHGGG